MIDIRYEFNRLNKKHWGGKLPTSVVIEWSDELPKDWMEGTYVLGTKKPWPKGCGRRPKHHLIRLRPFLKEWDCLAVMTLFHAMVHLEAALGDRRLEDHGRRFHGRMTALACMKAFDPYW